MMCFTYCTYKLYIYIFLIINNNNNNPALCADYMLVYIIAKEMALYDWVSLPFIMASCFLEILVLWQWLIIESKRQYCYNFSLYSNRERFGSNAPVHWSRCNVDTWPCCDADTWPVLEPLRCWHMASTEAIAMCYV